jgi:hypothetical protein
LLDHSLDVFVLSAEHGLIRADTAIPTYDRLMTLKRAEELRPGVLNVVRDVIGSQRYSEIFLSMGRTYLAALVGFESLLRQPVKVIISASSSGQKLTELKRWLWSLKESPIAARSAVTVASPKVIPQSVTLRGRCVQMTTQEAVTRLEYVIDQAEANGSARVVRDWYVDIKGEKLSPKWVASYLFNVPVREFSADEARRVLNGLGLICHRARADA